MPLKKYEGNKTFKNENSSSFQKPFEANYPSSPRTILKSIFQTEFSSPSLLEEGCKYANDGYLNPPPQRITLFRGKKAWSA
ncbi:hypothetical protein CEXT_390241 [Caerostris extrusa]|uniref:Uncharacterized protein n=1 Tax=Caerostris extrusa TaxID=172846 RepID=A0AAV4QAF5_CAEEX|nr:hypothetical protein CEXT_390241 [Caerostris extrusa]